jgi:hypothetical protein
MKKMVFGNYMNIDENHAEKTSTAEPPVWEDNDYYFGVIFPPKTNTLLGRWVFGCFHRWCFWWY